MAALVIVVAIVGASLGYAPTGGYFSDGEAANVDGEMPVAPVGNVADDNPAAEGSPVSLTGINSTDDSGILSYEWDFDDDGTVDARGMNQTHTYFDQGAYEVTIRVTDAAGLVDTETTTVAVENVPPTAIIGSDRTVDVDEIVTFDASASSDPGADDLTYEWDLDGDGEYDATGIEVDRQYRSEGTYAVALRVSDGDGGVDTDTLSVEVNNVPPTADAGANLTVVTGEPTLDGSDSVEGDSSDTLSYKWDVDGDGTEEAYGADPGYYYEENGTYNVTLRVSDGDGGADIDTTMVTVEPDTESPVANFRTNRRSVNDKTVAFDAADSSDNARIIEYEWDFGDGTTATGPSPAYTYSDPGKYDATLTVTDSAGYEDTTNVAIAVENVPPTADAGENQTVFAGEPLTLNASGSTEGDISDGLSYEWIFNDGNATETSDPTVDYIYSEEGTFNVTLQVRDGDGGVDTDTTTVTVQNAPPVADAGSNQTVSVNETAAFDGSTSSDPDGETLTYEWDLNGDGAFEESGTDVSRAYATSGTYTVTLRVSDGDGGVDTDTVSVTVE